MARLLAPSLLFGVVCNLAGAPLAGQAEPPKVARAVRTDTPPVIDGRLDEAVWQQAEVIADFRQAQPVEDSEPSERTEVRVLYDADRLYFGIRCFDREPDKIVATRMGRDSFLFSDDQVFLFLDPFHNRRDGYEFTFNAVGGRSDGLLTSGERAIREWDGIWDSAASIDDQGWVVEFALPFQTVSFDPGNDTWGMNIVREIRRKNETIRWSAPYLNKRGNDLGVAGDLVGLRGLHQGVGLDLIPYGLLEAAHDGTDEFEGTAGFDVRYHVTPSLTATVTVNTDFAATEVDDVQVNLTRFPLFFPEKRDFFLEDSNIFRFGGLGRDVLPFFSRRIGISPSGDPVDILAGAKLTGRAGPWNIGLLDVQQDSFGNVDSQNLAVGRLSYNLGEESTIGGIVTYGDPGTDFDNSLWGLDFNYRDSTFSGDSVLEGNLWYQQTDDGEVDERDRAFGGRLSWPNDTVSWEIEFRQVGDEFRPDLGFVRRRGVRRYEGRYRLRHRPETEGEPMEVRTIDTELSAMAFTDLDDKIETAEIEWEFLQFRNNIGDRLGFEVSWNKEVLDADFDISPGITIPIGDYEFYRYGFDFNSSSARPVGFDLRFENGEFFDGDRLSLGGGLQLRPSPHFTLRANYQFNHVDLPAGSFDTHVARVPMDLYFTPEHIVSIFPQYDNVSDEISLFARYRFIVEPGNDLFVVLNQGWFANAGSFQPTASALAVKLVWTFRF